MNRLLLSMLFAIVACASDYEKGETQFANGNYQQATSHYLRVETSDKDYSKAKQRLFEIDSIWARHLFDLGEKAYAEGRYADAEVLFFQIKMPDFNDEVQIFLAKIDSAQEPRKREPDAAKRYNKKVVSKPADQYNKSVAAITKQLNPESLRTRDSVIIELKKTPLYKELVRDRVVSQKYLPMLTGIGMLVSSWNGETSAMTGEISELIMQDKIQQEFISYNIMIGARGGLTQEVVELFYRYKNKYKYFGDNSSKNGIQERIENSYNLAIGLAVFEPNNKEVLEALYESVRANNYSWTDDENGNPEKYNYPYVLFFRSFKEHLNKVAPDSKYNFLKYKGIGKSVVAGHFKVIAIEYKVTNFIYTGNSYLNKQAPEGDTYLLLRAQYKNIDTEGRTILSAGSLFINYNGKEYQFDKTESILAEGFGVTFEALNPLSRKTTWLVFPIAAEIKGNVFWQPAASKEKIYLGDI